MLKSTGIVESSIALTVWMSQEWTKMSTVSRLKKQTIILIPMEYRHALATRLQA